MTPSSESWSIEVESFTSDGGSQILVRPAPGQRFPVKLLVEGNKSLANDYPVGSRFKVQVAPMKRAGAVAAYLYSSWQWDVVLLSRADAA